MLFSFCPSPKRTYPLIQVILAVIKLLRLCVPHELHVDLRVKLPTLGQLQLKHTDEHHTLISTSTRILYQHDVTHFSLLAGSKSVRMFLRGVKKRRNRQ